MKSRHFILAATPETCSVCLAGATGAGQGLTNDNVIMFLLYKDGNIYLFLTLEQYCHLCNQ